MGLIPKSPYPTGKSFVATYRLPVGYILQYHVKLGLNQKLLPTDKSFIATYESSAAPDDSSVATYGLPDEYMLQYQAKLGQNQKFVQTDDEIGHDVEEDQTPTPIVDIRGNSQLKQLNNLQDDETGFYIGMTFKNKDELVTSLHIACLKKDFRLAKMVSIVYPSAHYGCCMRHLGENIRNNFHNAKVVSHFYNAAKAYNKVEFYDHFNQIRDMVPKAAEHLESIGFHRWSKAFCPGNRYNIIY
uniref:Mutator-like transposase n=1 Tax=Solanum tuberosum TaxID=4113 RepID=M1CCI3_SOLTU